MIRFNKVRNSPLKAGLSAGLQRAALFDWFAALARLPNCFKALPFALALTACGTTPEPIIRVQQVLVPVPVSCVPDGLAPAPTYPDEGKAQDRAEWLARVLSGDALRRDRLADVEAVVAGCRASLP